MPNAPKPTKLQTIRLIGGICAVISILAIGTSVLAEMFSQPDTPATDSAVYVTLLCVFVGSVALSLGCGIVISRRGVDVRLWYFGLERLALVQRIFDFDGRDATPTAAPTPLEPAPPAAKTSHESGSRSIMANRGWSPEVGDRRRAYPPKHAPLWNNVVTISGMFLAVVALILVTTFGLFSIVSPRNNPYVDVAGYLVLPGALVCGLFLMPVGVLFKSWRIRRRDPTQRLAFQIPRIDLSDPMQRRVVKVVVAATFVMLPVIGVSSYHGYHYTDSTDFCAKACHAVMAPQATAYAHSAHARVACAECHVGSGASWFIKSKLSGTRQILAILNDSYSRPIPPAITSLRPSRDTCEQCHWPEKFFGAQLKVIEHYLPDEENSRRQVRMLIKTGGGASPTGRAEGIHKHMTLEGQIEYIATDERLQTIPWVKWTTITGQELIYRSDGRPSSDPKPEGETRRLDCMDCHNRPAHKFCPPQESVDRHLAAGRIETTLPFIKREAVNALIQEYDSVETAEARIGTAIEEFYRKHYPDIAETRRASIHQAVDVVREIYRRSFFPDMKVDWRTYPDNIGHLISPGCFRCHAGDHVNQHGESISHGCDICHDFLTPVDGETGTASFSQGEFVHSYDLAGPHADLQCHLCHTGGRSPVPDCAGCHSQVAAFLGGSLAGFEGMNLPADAMVGVVTCDACHDLEQPQTLESIDAACMDCHEDEEERFEGMLASWSTEVERLIQSAEAHTDAAGRQRLQALRRAGPLHNIEATRLIVRSLMGEEGRKGTPGP